MQLHSIRVVVRLPLSLRSTLVHKFLEIKKQKKTCSLFAHLMQCGFPSEAVYDVSSSREVQKNVTETTKKLMWLISR